MASDRLLEERPHQHGPWSLRAAGSALLAAALLATLAAPALALGEGVTVTESGGSTAVTEGGATDTYTLVLLTVPLANVVVTPSPCAEATVSPTSLTFTLANALTAQTVTVTAADDSEVEGTHTCGITQSASSGDLGYNGIAIGSVTATITDNDNAAFTVTQSGGSTSVSETGSTDTFTVVLAAQPVANVVLSVSSGDTGEATVSSSALTFTNGNWNSAQTVTVTGVDDALADGSQTATITLSIDDPNSHDLWDGLADQTVSVTVADDEVPAFTISQSGGATSVSEAGTTDSFTAVLAVQPVADVVFAVSSGDTGEATVSTSVLTFTGANWNTAQTVTVTGVDDAVVDGTQTATVTLSVNDALSADLFDPLGDQTVSVTVTDDEAAGFTLTQSGGSTTLGEAGGTDTVTVVLGAQPLSTVVLSASSSDTGEATVTPASLTFTTANWNTAQTLTVTGVDDTVVDGPQTVTVTVGVNDPLSADLFDPLADQTVSVTVTDNEAASFTVAQSGGTTTVSESGTTDTFTLVLGAQPLSNVVFSVSSSDTAEATASPTSLTFSTASWNTAQTVTVTGVDDPLDDGTQTVTVTVSVNDALSADLFDPLANQAVTVSVTDDDAPGITLAESGGGTAVAEGGASDTYTLVLTSQPSAAVTVQVAAGTQLTAAPTSVTFSTANWSTPRTVTVTAVDDDAVEGAHASSVAHAVASTDAGYAGLVVPSLSVFIGDNDAAGSVFEARDGTADEEPDQGTGAADGAQPPGGPADEARIRDVLGCVRPEGCGALRPDNTTGWTSGFDLTGTLLVERGEGGNELRWSRPPGAPVAGYQVWRSTSPWTLAANLSGNATDAYSDAGAPEEAKYKVTFYAGYTVGEGYARDSSELEGIPGWREAYAQAGRPAPPLETASRGPDRADAAAGDSGPGGWVTLGAILALVLLAAGGAFLVQRRLRRAAGGLPSVRRP